MLSWIRLTEASEVLTQKYFVIYLKSIKTFHDHWYFCDDFNDWYWIWKVDSRRDKPKSLLESTCRPAELHVSHRIFHSDSYLWIILVDGQKVEPLNSHFFNLYFQDSISRWNRGNHWKKHVVQSLFQSLHRNTKWNVSTN